MEEVRYLIDLLVGKEGLFLKQQGEIYPCCVRPVLFYCCETRELTVTDGARLCGVERRMIRIMCVVRLPDRVSNDIRDRMGVVFTRISRIYLKPPAVLWSCHAWRHEFPNT